MWTLDAALAFIRQHQDHARACDFNLALGGGVLNNGESAKDLDVIALPRCARRQPNLIDLMRPMVSSDQSVEVIEAGYDDDDMSGRAVYRFYWEGKMIDLIVVNFQWEQASH